jgi:glycerophosphoryl diester phosphodiesterase
VVTWTVNDPRQMVRIADMGVDAIISDDTQLLVNTLGNHQLDEADLRAEPSASGA